MTIVRLQHIGCAVSDYERATKELEALGLETRDFRDDQGKGFQYDSRALLGNDCWLHVVYNWNPESRVNRFLTERGPGLEHLALESDDVERDVARLRERNVPIFEDRIFDANDGFEAFVYPNDAIGFTVELIQPHRTSWGYPTDARGKPASAKLGRARLAEVGAAVDDVDSATRRFVELFGLSPDGRGRIRLGNATLVLVESGEAAGLREICVENEAGVEVEARPGAVPIRLRHG
jgi:catechol 2,3-dioxygenase-like lactoylglutathione lyase family enzyme